MIAAFDVKYFDDGSALSAAVVFNGFEDTEPLSHYTKRIEKVEEYVPGAFYKRELPCIISLLGDIREKIDVIIVDGYVTLGNEPGLGAHLKEAIDDKIAVIGAAKSYFEGSNAIKVYRGKSKNPLYVSSAGIGSEEAARLISGMHGENRIPTLLKAADRLTKEGTLRDALPG